MLRRSVRGGPERQSVRLLAPADDASARTAAMRRLLVGSFVMRVHFAMRAGLVEA